MLVFLTACSAATRSSSDADGQDADLADASSDDSDLADAEVASPIDTGPDAELDGDTDAERTDADEEGDGDVDADLEIEDIRSWTVSFDSSGFHGFDRSYSRSDGSFVVTGMFGELFAMALDTTGSVLWQGQYGFSSDLAFYIVSTVATTDGGILNLSYLDPVYYIIRLGQDGEVRWSARAPHRDQELSGAVELPDGSAVVIARSDDGAAEPIERTTVFRVTPEAEVLWARELSADLDLHPRFITRLGDRTIVAAWLGGYRRVLWLGAFDEDGALLWQRGIDFLGHHRVWDFHGGTSVLAIGGDSTAEPATPWLMTLDGEGSPLWWIRHSLRSADEFRASRITVSPEDEIMWESHLSGVPDSGYWIARLDGEGTVRYQGVLSSSDFSRFTRYGFGADTILFAGDDRFAFESRFGVLRGDPTDPGLCAQLTETEEELTLDSFGTVETDVIVEETSYELAPAMIARRDFWGAIDLTCSE